MKTYFPLIAMVLLAFACTTPAKKSISTELIERQNIISDNETNWNGYQD
ncbi:MAG: hypothetical protein JNK09_17950 [Prolixibacteraceae bacterium]|nr:hypothetical protein [Prolixibacteraceae bacterium]